MFGTEHCGTLFGTEHRRRTVSAPIHDMTLKEIQEMTGHENTDAVRMALHRAKIKSTGVRVSLSWPPLKLFSAAKVWNLFSARIIRRIEDHPELKETCWSHFGYQIREASAGKSVGTLFDDKMA